MLSAFVGGGCEHDAAAAAIPRREACLWRAKKAASKQLLLAYNLMITSDFPSSASNDTRRSRGGGCSCC